MLASRRPARGPLSWESLEHHDSQGEAVALRIPEAGLPGLWGDVPGSPEGTPNRDLREDQACGAPRALPHQRAMCCDIVHWVHAGASHDLGTPGVRALTWLSRKSTKGPQEAEAVRRPDRTGAVKRRIQTTLRAFSLCLWGRSLTLGSNAALANPGQSGSRPPNSAPTPR